MTGRPFVPRDPAVVAALYRNEIERWKVEGPELRQRSPRPVVVIAKHYHVSQATAGRMITEARRLGLLGPALRARAGEAEERAA